MHEPHDEDAKHQQDAMLGDRSPMTLTSIRQGARSTEHLGDGNQTEHQEYHPDNFVAFEYRIK